MLLNHDSTQVLFASPKQNSEFAQRVLTVGRDRVIVIVVVRVWPHPVHTMKRFLLYRVIARCLWLSPSIPALFITVHLRLRRSLMFTRYVHKFELMKEDFLSLQHLHSPNDVIRQSAILRRLRLLQTPWGLIVQNNDTQPHRVRRAHTTASAPVIKSLSPRTLFARCVCRIGYKNSKYCIITS